jgi:hypothetical protein
VARSRKALLPKNSNISSLVDEISTLLSETYRVSVDQESLPVFQACFDISNDIEKLKERIKAC